MNTRLMGWLAVALMACVACGEPSKDEADVGGGGGDDMGIDVDAGGSGVDEPDAEQDLLDGSIRDAEYDTDTGLSEIAPGIVAIPSFAFDSPGVGLDVLPQIVEDSTIVSLGETIHFSDGYAYARARIIRYLIEEMGFRAVAWEGSWTRASLTRAFVERDEGTLSDAAVGLTFAAWWNEPTYDLLEWLRDWNLAHPDDPVRVFAFDVQEPPGDGRVIREALADLELDDEPGPTIVDPCPAARYDTFEEVLEDPEEDAIVTLAAELSDERRDACAEALAQLSAWVASSRTAIEAALGVERLAHLDAAIAALRGSNDLYYFASRDNVASYEGRDKGMADVFDILRPFYADGERVAVFAHNSHNRRRAGDLVDGFVYESYGTWLGERHGDDYAPIGFFAHEVAWTWPNEVGSGVWTATDPSSVEVVLHELGAGDLIVDLVRATGPRLTFTTGAYGMGHAPTDTGSPLRHYRALVFLERSESRP